VLEIAAPRPLPREDQPPVVAVLDGMPMENHPLLDGRLIVDDPEGWALPTLARELCTAAKPPSARLVC
jgi:hypothetical protein